MGTRRRRRPLQPAELAEAVVLADLSLALTVVGQLVPLGYLLVAAAVVPLAVVGARHRLRAVVTGALAAGVVGFLVIGTAALTTLTACALVGGLVGASARRGWGRRKTIILGTAMLWPPVALVADLVLLLFTNLRELTLDNVRNAWHGLFHLAANLKNAMHWLIDNPAFGIAVAAFVVVQVLSALNQAGRAPDHATRRELRLRTLASVVALAIGIAMIELLGNSQSGGDRAIGLITRNWWVSVPLALLVSIVFGIWLAQGLSAPALRRVGHAFVAETGTAVKEDTGREPAPLPVHTRDLSYRYPHATRLALDRVAVDVAAGELVAVVGANGSGKSTLARLLGGRLAPTAGAVQRPGPAGLGRAGGTAIVFQRPEAQVLGMRVRDDVVWGLADPHAVDADALLRRVGLAELAARETSTLSGGELQRLAIAAALARRPQLLISDESTAMVDVEGRARIVGLLERLARDDGLGVVHVTHHAAEAARATRTIALEAGKVVDAPAVLRAGTPASGLHSPAISPPPGAPVMTLRDVGHVYSRATPWENRALAGIDLEIRRGEALLVVGHNGSGKSTLAWILAGLLLPTEGSATLGNEPLVEHVGRVGLSFQHARLQLLRPTVLDDVRAAAGVDPAAAAAALRAVGLDPEMLANARVDELSGGQTRRVVLAGVLAADPVAIVLDEPFAGLDADGRDELAALLEHLRVQRGVALVVVSHDDDLPEGLIDRVVELRAGRVVRDDRLRDSVAESGPA